MLVVNYKGRGPAMLMKRACILFFAVWKVYSQQAAENFVAFVDVMQQEHEH
jgi:hypothetical protein